MPGQNLWLWPWSCLAFGLEGQAYIKAYDISEHFLRKSLAQVTFARKLA